MDTGVTTFVLRRHYVTHGETVQNNDNDVVDLHFLNGGQSRLTNKQATCVSMIVSQFMIFHD